MKINMFNIFKKKQPIQNDFSIQEFLPLDIDRSIYPLFSSLEEKGVSAYFSRFMVKLEDLTKITGLIEQWFHKSIFQEIEQFYDHGKTLCYYRFDELEHLAVDIITNDNYFITRLNDLKLEPPSPDVMFPQSDLESYGSLQGSLAFWWDVYWEPFWNGLTEDKRIEYIESNNLLEGAASFIKFHER